MKIEVLPLIVNICCFSYYAYRWEDFGKILYWMGAIVLTMGLMKMRG